MNFTIEELEQFNIYGLRSIAREVGVKAPTKLKREQLIEEILLIKSGAKKPYIPSKIGRPVKMVLTDMIGQPKDYNGKTKEEIIKTILNEIEIKLKQIL